ncbi:MAG: cobalt-zinc-cadmium resistance protein [Rhodocyclaceae bacterium]|jgi:cobalt-zinc-cadmium efflux system outer membrane protein|nr:cobalt-zinc-cadmium resistance protein [Rhodocyclaceae bacterium]
MSRRRLVLPLGLAASVLISGPLSAQSAEDPAPYADTRSQPPAVEPVGPLTLEAALALALQASPDLAVARREVDAVAATRRQAQLFPNPEVSLDTEDTGNRKGIRQMTLQLGQTFLLGGKRGARIEAAERARDVAEAELTTLRSAVRAAVMQAFYELLAAQERQRLARDSLDLARRALEVAARRVTAGKVSPVEETRARVALAAAQVELTQAAAELANTRKRLSATWGNPAPRFTQASGQLDAPPPLPALDELLARLDAAPETLRARREIERRDAVARLERTRRIPDVTISAGVQRKEELRDNVAVVGVSIPIPVFDRNQGNVLEALRRADKARDEQTAVGVRLRSELAQAYERLDAARREVDYIRQDILPGAQSVLDAATKGFELGKFTFLDVLDAQRTLFQGRGQYVRALADVQRAAANIEAILGPQAQATVSPTNSQ